MDGILWTDRVNRLDRRDWTDRVNGPYWFYGIHRCDRSDRFVWVDGTHRLNWTDGDDWANGSNWTHRATGCCRPHGADGYNG